MIILGILTESSYSLKEVDNHLKVVDSMSFDIIVTGMLFDVLNRLKNDRNKFISLVL